jgi:hypothetical protein
MTQASEKRASKRLPNNIPILFTVSHADKAGHDVHERQNANIIDISSTGMGIFTTSHITTGQFVTFVKNQPNWELPPKGLVVWSLKHGTGFRAGLEFILEGA